MQGQNMLSVRENNRKKILLGLKNSTLSRTDLAKKLGLTNAAVTILTNHMLQENILVELGAKELSVKRHGRKEVMLDINKNFAYAMGVVVINNIFQIAIVNLKCEILVKKTYSFEPPVSYYDFLDQLKDYMRELIWQNNLSKDKIIGIGFSMPGYLDSSDKGIVYDSFGIWKERNVPVEKILEEYFSIKVYLDNYNKNLALAEFMGRELDNVMFLDYTDTVELSIWTKDEVYKGANNYSGMVGHMIVDYNSSKICPICGNRGCLSTIISNFAVQRAIAQNFMNGELPELYEKYDGRLKKVTLYDVFLLHDKYSFINNIMEMIIQYLSIAIVNIHKVLDFDYLVLYGNTFKIQAFLEKLKIQVKNLSKENIFLKLSNLDHYTPVIGPCSNVIYKKFFVTGGDLED